MGIRRLLFGERLVLQDDFFGTVESDRTRSKATKYLSWYFEVRIGDFKKDTFIIAEGDYLGINNFHKELLKDFVHNFQEVYSCQLDKMMNRYSTNWKKEYYISTIHPALDEIENKYEVIIESYRNKNDSFMVALIDGELTAFFKI